MSGGKGGPATKYSEKLADTICERIALGESMRAICRDEGMPEERTVYRWLAKDAAFCQQYAEARARAMEVFADEIVEIADDGARDTYTDSDGNEHTNHDVIARAKLRVDTRKWLMSKLAPKKYGDRMAVEHDVSDKLADRIKAARERAAQG